MADLKAVYAAVDESFALDVLNVFPGHWDKKYPQISASWQENWPNLSTYFKYPQEAHLHHKCHRGFQPPAPKNDKGKVGFSD
jgi:transposase-like protein